jgi:cell wall-associated NlpC family hydrolase
VRRLVVVLSAVFVAVFMVSFVALSAEATPAGRQYVPSDGSKDSGNAPESGAPSDGAPESNFVSQGSNGTEDTPEALAARADLAEEERLPDYSQVVDNSTKGRFVAPGWSHVSGDDDSHGADYAVARAGSDARSATFRVKIPTNNDYAVYAWWPAAKNNASAARFVISTASGPRTEKVNETKEGGMWIKLGDFEMKKGARTVQVSPSGDDNVVADAVAIVRGGQTPIYEDATGPAEGGDVFRAAATSTANGGDIVREARKYKGTRYRYATCTSTLMSCTCLTRRAVYPFGHNFPMTELGQWRYEPSGDVKYKAGLEPGDIVFFKENGRSGPITHVGVYSGRGYLVHASTYFGKVVESQMRYVRGYFGAIRVRPR